MPDALTDAQTFRDAATKLRQFVADFGDNRGPWYVSANRGYPQEISNIGVPYVVAQCFDEPTKPLRTAPYIATMHPGVALALVATFESWLRVAEVGGDLGGRVGGVEALAIAREILRGGRIKRH